MYEKNINKNIALIVSDIEGCLSNAKGMPLDLLMLNTIKLYNLSAAKDVYPLLTLCTGRPQPFVEAFCQMLAVTVPCVCENGVIIYNPSTDQTFIHPNITNKHLQASKELKQKLSEDISKTIPHRIEPGKEICISLNPLTNPDQYADKVKELYEKIRPVVDQNLFEITCSASAVDITPKGIDKGAGLEYLCELTHIPLDNMLGIGDTLGDLPFLNKVGYICVPANAQDALKEMADFVSPKKCAEGVVDIIQHFVK